jgi:heme/copper-type cytochrome/quinol oxidase subunit 3
MNRTGIVQVMIVVDVGILLSWAFISCRSPLGRTLTRMHYLPISFGFLLLSSVVTIAFAVSSMLKGESRRIWLGNMLSLALVIIGFLLLLTKDTSLIRF